MNPTEKRERIMVLLVGGRLTPNFIGVFGYRPTMIECVVSEDAEQKYDEVLDVLDPLPDVELAQPRSVPAFDMQQVMDVCQAIVDAHPGARVLFNVTCGTKVMGIAAYEVAKRARQPAIYVDTTHGRFLNLTEPGEEAIPFRIGLEAYLGFYGRCPERSFDFSSLSIPEDKALAAAAYLAEAGTAATETLAWMRRQNRGSGRRTIHAKGRKAVSAGWWQVLGQLEGFGLLSNLERRSEAEVSYLIAADADWMFLDGTWLEVYAWDQARRCTDDQGQPLFDECGLSFEIPGEGGARKEIDVACMYRGQLIHGSCKSGHSPFKTSALDELRAVSSLIGGRFCSRLFITNIDPPEEGTSAGYAYELFLQQARDREIVVVTGRELPDIGAILKCEAIRPTYWRV